MLIKCFPKNKKRNKSNRVTKKPSREKRGLEILEEIKLKCKEFENQVLEELNKFIISSSASQKSQK